LNSERKQRLAIIGDPISHALSPVLQSFLIRHFGVPFTYEALQVRSADLPEMMQRLRSDNFRGINVTIPHKQAVVPFLDELDEAAARIGAVNTIVVDGARLIGYNTDASGFLHSLEAAKIAVGGKRAFVLGAGGAARAVVFALMQAGAETIFICNRSNTRAESLIVEFAPNIKTGQIQNIPWANRISWFERQRADLIINATSVGMHPRIDEMPLPPHVFVPHMVAIDLVYNPRHTAFLQAAKTAGATVVGGLGMLIHQGVAALALWSQQQLDIDDIYSSLEKQLMDALETKP
jgi:shikimate dehydrogenase